MPEKYKQLAIHNSVCNEVYYKLQDCDREHPITRFIGECTPFLKNLEKCIKENRTNMRAKNREMSKTKQNKIQPNLSSEQ